MYSEREKGQQALLNGLRRQRGGGWASLCLLWGLYRREAGVSRLAQLHVVGLPPVLVVADSPAVTSLPACRPSSRAVAALPDHRPPSSALLTRAVGQTASQHLG